MKKLVVILFILCTVFFLFGCQQDLSALVNGYVSGDLSAPTSQATSSTTPTQSEYKSVKPSRVDSCLPQESTDIISPDIGYTARLQLKIFASLFSTSYDIKPKLPINNTINSELELENLLSEVGENSSLYRDLLGLSEMYPLSDYTYIRLHSNENQGGVTVTVDSVTVDENGNVTVSYIKNYPEIGLMVMCSWDMFVIVEKIENINSVDFNLTLDKCRLEELN